MSPAKQRHNRNVATPRQSKLNPFTSPRFLTMDGRCKVSVFLNQIATRRQKSSRTKAVWVLQTIPQPHVRTRCRSFSCVQYRTNRNTTTSAPNKKQCVSCLTNTLTAAAGYIIEHARATRFRDCAIPEEKARVQHRQRPIAGMVSTSQYSPLRAGLPPSRCPPLSPTSRCCQPMQPNVASCQGHNSLHVACSSPGKRTTESSAGSVRPTREATTRS